WSDHRAEHFSMLLVRSDISCSLMSLVQSDVQMAEMPPPSTPRMTPLICAASGLARKATAFATSCVWPGRANTEGSVVGTVEASRVPIRGEEMGPGDTTLARTPCSRYASEIPLVNRLTAAFM